MKKEKICLIRQIKMLVPLYLLTLLPLLTSCGDFFEYDQTEAIPAGEMVLGRESVDLIVGDRYEIPVSFSPEILSNKEVYWFSNNHDIVDFEDNTLVAVGEGKAIVTAISVSGQYKAICTVNVYPQWNLSVFHLPYDMVLYGDITIKGRPMDDNMTLLAYIDGKLSGVSQQKESNGIKYIVLRIFSEEHYGKWVTLKCYDAANAKIYDLETSFIFDDETYGSLSNLLHFTIE